MVLVIFNQLEGNIGQSAIFYRCPPPDVLSDFIKKKETESVTYSEDKIPGEMVSALFLFIFRLLV